MCTNKLKDGSNFKQYYLLHIEYESTDHGCCFCSHGNLFAISNSIDRIKDSKSSHLHVNTKSFLSIFSSIIISPS